MNQQLHTNRGKNIAETLFVSLLFLLILLLLMPAGCCCAFAPEQLCQERIYAADVNTVNPELEGKLVKLEITEIHSDAEVEDALFGIRGRFLVLSRDVVDIDRECEGTQFICNEDVDILLSEGMMDGIRSSRFSPAKMRSGAFTLLHAGRFLKPDSESPLLPLPPREQWPAVLRETGEQPEPGIILWRNSEHPDELFANLRFRSLPPGVLYYPLYVVARQRGNTLDMNDAHAASLLYDHFMKTQDVGDMNGYDGLGLGLFFMAAVVCTPAAWALLTLFLRLCRTLSKQGAWSWTSLTVAVVVLLLLSLHQMFPSFPVSPIVLFLLLLPLLIWCLSLCCPRFSCRMSALLYLPTIIFVLGAVLPFDFQWELRLPLAVLSVLSALVAVHLTRRRTMSPNKKAVEHAI